MLTLSVIAGNPIEMSVSLEQTESNAGELILVGFELLLKKSIH
ncbi:hypothetical protein [Treponema phagedenis]|nr:hypothetical protein [Treponema phagedenis]EFW37537.1 hypothetical protein HMPREF9554_01977 [Treponema phagedenis F0421]